MKFQLIDGDFNQTETIDLISKLVQVKINFHEDKIKNSHNEEDIKMRERKITLLQNNLAEARNFIRRENKNFHIDSEISF